MITTTVREHGHGQMVVIYGKRHVAYICIGPNMPINWLPRQCSGVVLTDEEKLTVARAAREQMEVINAEHERVKNELATLTSGAASGPIERADTELGNEASDSGSPDA